jgi:hypothetical protein
VMGTSRSFTQWRPASPAHMLMLVAFDCTQPALPICYRETERNVISNTSCCQWQTAWPANLPQQLGLTLSMEGHRLYVNRLASNIHEYVDLCSFQWSRHGAA